MNFWIRLFWVNWWTSRLASAMEEAPFPTSLVRGFCGICHGLWRRGMCLCFFGSTKNTHPHGCFWRCFCLCCSNIDQQAPASFVWRSQKRHFLASNKTHNSQNHHFFDDQLPLAWRQSPLLARWSVISEFCFHSLVWKVTAVGWRSLKLLDIRWY